MKKNDPNESIRQNSKRKTPQNGGKQYARYGAQNTGYKNR